MPTVQTRSELMDALYGKVQATWEANVTSASAPLYYDNLEARRPSDPSLWGRAVILHNFGTTTTVGPAGRGAKTDRRFGDLYVQIFAPAGDGMFEIGNLADDLASAFEAAPVSFPVRVTDTNINEIGVDDDGVYFQLNVIVGFSYDRVS